MVRLIDDMLDVSRLRRSALAIWPKPADLGKLVRLVIDDFAEQAASAGCQITLEAPDTLPGVWDVFRIEQVLANLLTNSLRYGAGKPVHVAVRPTADGAHITVRDQGRGIAAADLERIFGQFERAAGTEQSPGLGLGLYITRQIVTAHGGSISADSTPGQGAVFTVLLPLDASTLPREER